MCNTVTPHRVIKPMCTANIVYSASLNYGPSSNSVLKIVTKYYEKFIAAK
ncbi:hypothetical protein GCM10025776_23670 [Corallincola platygyrae]